MAVKLQLLNVAKVSQAKQNNKLMRSDSLGKKSLAEARDLG